MQIKMDDWISYYRNGKFKISVVLGVRQQDHYPHEHEILTPNGIVAFSSVIEVRPSIKERLK